MSQSRDSLPGVDTALSGHLSEVLETGAPAQRDEARRLARALRENPADATALSDAARLVDAYLHDPYLDRGQAKVTR